MFVLCTWTSFFILVRANDLTTGADLLLVWFSLILKFTINVDSYVFVHLCRHCFAIIENLTQVYWWLSLGLRILCRQVGRYFSFCVQNLPYLTWISLLYRSNRLANTLPNAVNQLASKGTLVDMIAFHHIRLNSFNDFLLTLLVDLLCLLYLGEAWIKWVIGHLWYSFRLNFRFNPIFYSLWDFSRLANSKLLVFRANCCRFGWRSHFVGTWLTILLKSLLTFMVAGNSRINLTFTCRSLGTC